MSQGIIQANSIVLTSTAGNVDLSLTAKGLLPPKMTTTQRNAIPTPAAGLIVFNTTSGLLEIYSGTAWRTVAAKEQFYCAETNGALGSFRTRSINTNGNFNFIFKVPRDFTSLVSIVAVGIPGAGAAGAGKNIDLVSNYGLDTQAYNVNNQSDVASTYTVGAANTLWELSLATVFTALAAGAYCGINIAHNTIGGAVDYIGVRLQYI